MGPMDFVEIAPFLCLTEIINLLIFIIVDKTYLTTDLIMN